MSSRSPQAPRRRSNAFSETSSDEATPKRTSNTTDSQQQPQQQMTYCHKTGTWIGNEDDVQWDLMSEADLTSEADTSEQQIQSHSSSLPQSQQHLHATSHSTHTQPFLQQMVTSIAVLHEFHVDDAMIHEWTECESSHSDLAPWFASVISDPFADSDVQLRNALLRRVVADCERAGAVLRRSRSSGNMLTPRNHSPSYVAANSSSGRLNLSSRVDNIINTSSNNLINNGNSGANGATTSGSAANTPAAAPAANNSAVGVVNNGHGITTLQASGEGELEFSRSHELTIDDSESDLDEAFEAGDFSARFMRANPMRSPRRPSRVTVPMLTFQALQALSNTAPPSAGGINSGGSTILSARHRRTDSGEDEASFNASGSALRQSRPPLVPPATASTSSAPAPVRTRTSDGSLSSRRRPSAITSSVRSQPRVDLADFSAYSDVGSLRMDTPLSVAVAPQFVSLATSYGALDRSSDYWIPETPYRPRASDAPAAPLLAIPVSHAPPFVISRTGEWLKSN